MKSHIFYSSYINFKYKKHKQDRLYNFDYSQDGYYFITIVTKDREHFFGEIAKQKMNYSPIGEYAKANILKFYIDENLENLIKDESIKIIFVCSPNNPTGNLINKESV